jgi:hypothetical protein
MTTQIRTLIFVYNADSCLRNLAFDIAHKLISPATYQCSLCALTHGVLSERDEWRRFRDESPDELLFLHRDEFERDYPPQPDYPLVLERTTEGLRPLVTPEELRALPDLPALMALLRSR